MALNKRQIFAAARRDKDAHPNEYTAEAREEGERLAREEMARWLVSGPERFAARRREAITRLTGRPDASQRRIEMELARLTNGGWIVGFSGRDDNPGEFLRTILDAIDLRDAEGNRGLAGRSADPIGAFFHAAKKAWLSLAVVAETHKYRGPQQGSSGYMTDDGKVVVTQPAPSPWYVKPCNNAEEAQLRKDIDAVWHRDEFRALHLKALQATTDADIRRRIDAVADAIRPLHLVAALSTLDDWVKATNKVRWALHDLEAWIGDKRESEGGKPPADPFAELRRFARDKLKGQERAVIEALCDAGGELPIADLAVKAGVGWDDEFQGFKDVQRRLNPKLKAEAWRLERRSNAARLMSAKEGAKSSRFSPD